MIRLTDKRIWSGRLDDEDGELGTRWHQKIEMKRMDELTVSSDDKIALIGFCSDEGVKRNKGRVGAAGAPDAIRRALANLPYQPDSQHSIYDFGNIELEDDQLEAARSLQIDVVADLIKHHYLPIVLGGGHETALGDYLALAEGHQNIGIINIDAHYDLRIPVEHSTSGTPFFEMAHHSELSGTPFHYFVIGIQETGNTRALFQRAEDLGVETVLADEVHIDLNFALRKLEDFIAGLDVVYLSLDLDVLDGAFAPGVSAPSVNGLTPMQVKTIIQTVKNSGKLKLFDVVELNPNYDQDNRTAKLAAHFIQTLSMK